MTTLTCAIHIRLWDVTQELENRWSSPHASSYKSNEPVHWHVFAHLAGYQLYLTLDALLNIDYIIIYKSPRMLVAGTFFWFVLVIVMIDPCLLHLPDGYYDHPRSTHLI